MGDVLKVFDVKNKQAYTSLHNYFQINQATLGTEICKSVAETIRKQLAARNLDKSSGGVLLSDFVVDKDKMIAAVKIMPLATAKEMYDAALAEQDVVLPVPPVATVKPPRKRIAYQPK